MRSVVSAALKKYWQSSATKLLNDVVVVGHGIDNDMKFVEGLGIGKSTSSR